jgi:hypothetical protein
MEYLNNSFFNNEGVKAMRSGLEEQLYRGRITSYKAALTLIDKYLKK